VALVGATIFVQHHVLILTLGGLPQTGLCPLHSTLGVQWAMNAAVMGEALLPDSGLRVPCIDACTIDLARAVFHFGSRGLLLVVEYT
jgi:hypothetical protein